MLMTGLAHCLFITIIRCANQLTLVEILCVTPNTVKVTWRNPKDGEFARLVACRIVTVS